MWSITEAKKLDSFGLNSTNSPDPPMNGRRTQLICAPTHPKMTIQMRKTVLT